MKIREGTPAFHEGMKLFGASPAKIDLNEMFIALQQGIVDAIEFPLDYIYDHSLHETAKFLLLIPHNLHFDAGESSYFRPDPGAPS